MELLVSISDLPLYTLIRFAPHKALVCLHQFSQRFYVHTELQQSLESINAWLDSNALRLNVKKCLIIANSHKRRLIDRNLLLSVSG